MKPSLIFVYNANSGIFNSFTDFAHKIISPSTYACNLCALTYGGFSMKEEWKTFIQQLPAEVVFLHKDEFENTYKFQTRLPAVFIKENDKLNSFITDKEIDNCTSLQQIEDLITTQLALRDQHHHSNI